MWDPDLLRESRQSGARSLDVALQEVEIIHKNVYVQRDVKHWHEDDIPVCSCRLGEDDEFGCLEDCENRASLIECLPNHCPCGDRCANQRMQRGEYPSTSIRECGHKGLGLFTEQSIAKGDLVGEYMGEIVTEREYFKRKVLYRYEKHRYMMALNNDEVIDATRKGGRWRFMNHSCEPNCNVEKWEVDGEERLGIFALRDIQKGEELCFDYKFESFANIGTTCLCNATKCRGLIGVNNHKTDQQRASGSSLGHDSAASGGPNGGMKNDTSRSSSLASMKRKVLDPVIPTDLTSFTTIKAADQLLDRMNRMQESRRLYSSRREMLQITFGKVFLKRNLRLLFSQQFRSLIVRKLLTMDGDTNRPFCPDVVNIRELLYGGWPPAHLRPIKEKTARLDAILSQMERKKERLEQLKEQQQQQMALARVRIAKPSVLADALVSQRRRARRHSDSKVIEISDSDFSGAEVEETTKDPVWSRRQTRSFVRTHTKPKTKPKTNSQKPERTLVSAADQVIRQEAERLELSGLLSATTTNEPPTSDTPLPPDSTDRPPIRPESTPESNETVESALTDVPVSDHLARTASPCTAPIVSAKDPNYAAKRTASDEVAARVTKKSRVNPPLRNDDENDVNVQEWRPQEDPTPATETYAPESYSSVPSTPVTQPDPLSGTSQKDSKQFAPPEQVKEGQGAAPKATGGMKRIVLSSKATVQAFKKPRVMISPPPKPKAISPSGDSAKPKSPSTSRTKFACAAVMRVRQKPEAIRTVSGVDLSAFRKQPTLTPKPSPNSTGTSPHRISAKQQSARSVATAVGKLNAPSKALPKETSRHCGAEEIQVEPSPRNGVACLEIRAVDESMQTIDTNTAVATGANPVSISEPEDSCGDDLPAVANGPVKGESLENKPKRGALLDLLPSEASTSDDLVAIITTSEVDSGVSATSGDAEQGKRTKVERCWSQDVVANANASAVEDAVDVRLVEVEPTNSLMAASGPVHKSASAVACRPLDLSTLDSESSNDVVACLEAIETENTKPNAPTSTVTEAEALPQVESSSSEDLVAGLEAIAADNTSTCAPIREANEHETQTLSLPSDTCNDVVVEDTIADAEVEVEAQPMSLPPEDSISSEDVITTLEMIEPEPPVPTDLIGDSETSNTLESAPVDQQLYEEENKASRTSLVPKRSDLESAAPSKDVAESSTDHQACEAAHIHSSLTGVQEAPRSEDVVAESDPSLTKIVDRNNCTVNESNAQDRPSLDGISSNDAIACLVDVEEDSSMIRVPDDASGDEAHEAEKALVQSELSPDDRLAGLERKEPATPSDSHKKEMNSQSISTSIQQQVKCANKDTAREQDGEHDDEEEPEQELVDPSTSTSMSSAGLQENSFPMPEPEADHTKCCINGQARLLQVQVAHEEIAMDIPADSDSE